MIHLISTALLVIAVVIVFFIIFVAIPGYIIEMKDYNDGICPYCGNRLIYFDTDSTGAEGYHCERCGYSCWVSWFKPRRY